MSMETTTIDIGPVALQTEVTAFEDALLTFGGAGTVLKGTILARSSETGNLVPYAVGGSNGSGTPLAVTTYEITATGAGNVAMRALMKGSVNLSRLVIHADGDASNITHAIRDALRSYGIHAVEVSQLGKYDNV